jgi:hypothetical protein
LLLKILGSHDSLQFAIVVAAAAAAAAGEERDVFSEIC